MMTYKGTPTNFNPPLRRRVLGLTSSINDIGELRWELVLCSLGTWTVVSLALIKGIKSSGKVCCFEYLRQIASKIKI